MKWLGVAAAAALLLTVPASASEKLSMRVSPSVAFAPSNLVVRAIVSQDAANRAIAVIAESADFYRSSEMQLDGDKAPRTSVFEFRSLPSGSYQVSAVLIGPKGEQRALARAQVDVMTAGPGER